MSLNPSSYKGVLWGLCNPGPAYQGTRHNLGAMALGGLVSGSEPKPGLRVGRAFERLFEDERWLLVENLVYMNDSGALAEALLESGFKPGAVLVLVDDLDLPFGSLRLREAGSPGNHNGLKSIASVWGENFARLRLGIAPAAPLGPDPKVTVVDSPGWKDFVLGRFSPAEEAELPDFLADAARAGLDYFKEGLLAARNKWNRRGLRQTKG